MTQSVFFLHDPELDVSYRGSTSLSMKIFCGDVGYAEFAGKILQVASAVLYGDGSVKWQNGTLWRFDENGLVDQDYVRATADAIVEKAFSENPYGPNKSAEWQMRMRRADVNRDMMDWNINPALRKRLDDYIISGVKHTKIKTTRGLTKTFKTEAGA